MVKKKRKKKTLDRSRTPARWAHRYACLQCACKRKSSLHCNLHDDAWIVIRGWRSELALVRFISVCQMHGWLHRCSWEPRSHSYTYTALEKALLRIGQTQNEDETREAKSTAFQNWTPHWTFFSFFLKKLHSTYNLLDTCNACTLFFFLKTTIYPWWTKSFFVRVTTNYTLSRRPFSLPIRVSELHI